MHRSHRSFVKSPTTDWWHPCFLSKAESACRTKVGPTIGPCGRGAKPAPKELRIQRAHSSSIETSHRSPALSPRFPRASSPHHAVLRAISILRAHSTASVQQAAKFAIRQCPCSWTHWSADYLNSLRNLQVAVWTSVGLLVHHFCGE
jgi:hypothetical protein